MDASSHSGALATNCWSAEWGGLVRSLHPFGAGEHRFPALIDATFVELGYVEHSVARLRTAISTAIIETSAPGGHTFAASAYMSKKTLVLGTVTSEHLVPCRHRGRNRCCESALPCLDNSNANVETMWTERAFCPSTLITIRRSRSFNADQ